VLFSLSWLKEFLEFNADVNKVAESLTDLGLEVENISNKANGLEDFIIAQIIDAKPHPDANKLQCCKVKISEDEVLDIVCGAKNARVGINVVLAPVGVVIPSNGMKIKASEIRGKKVMVCYVHQKSWVLVKMKMMVY